jgi:hypothetical protein
VFANVCTYFSFDVKDCSMLGFCFAFTCCMLVLAMEGINIGGRYSKEVRALYPFWDNL